MDLKLPPLGEGVDSGSVVGILVKEGDQITKGQGVIELETGKAVAPVPSTANGKVTKILVAVGDKISVGQAMISLDGAGAPAAQGESRRADNRRLDGPSVPHRLPCGRKKPRNRSPKKQWTPMLHRRPPLRASAASRGNSASTFAGFAAANRAGASSCRICALISGGSSAAAQAQTAAGPRQPAPPPRIDFARWGAVTKRPMTSFAKPSPRK